MLLISNSTRSDLLLNFLLAGVKTSDLLRCQASEAGYAGYDAQAAGFPGYDQSHTGHTGYDAGYDPSGQYAYGTPAYPTGAAAMPPQPQPSGMPAAPAPGPEVPQPGQAAW